MSKRRPLAADRDIADHLFDLPDGIYLIQITDYRSRMLGLSFPGFAPRERSMRLGGIGGRRIDIYRAAKEEAVP